MTTSNRESESSLAQEKTSSGPRLLLVDDDPTFGRILGRLAEQAGIPLTFCRSLDELGEQAWCCFDAAIVDYNLGTATGIELIRQLERSLGDLPIILISGSHHVDTPISRWPTSIKGFLLKELGHAAILEIAVASRGSREKLDSPSIPAQLGVRASAFGASPLERQR